MIAYNCIHFFNPIQMSFVLNGTPGKKQMTPGKLLEFDLDFVETLTMEQTFIHSVLSSVETLIWNKPLYTQFFPL